MINLKKILCPVDLSEASMLALRYANAVAGRYGATLTIIHVLENPHFDIPGGETGTFSFGELVELYREERKEEILDVLRHKGAVTVQFDILFKEGVPYDEITKTAREINSDMIIMSTCTKAHGLLAGCTTERVVRLAPCPVLSVQTNREDVKDLSDIMDTDPRAKRTILLPTDFSEHSMLAARYAISFASEYKADLIVLYILETVAQLTPTVGIDLPIYGVTAYYDDLLQVAQRRISEICNQASQYNIRAHDRILRGNPRHEILNVAESEQIDLIVIGTHGRRGFSRFIHGSVAEAVVRHAPCSVLSVRHPEHDFVNNSEG